jgi:hypothetical protein
VSNFENPFVLKAPEYQRDLDLFKHYVAQTVSYLMTMTGATEEEALAYVKKNLGPDGKFPFKDPKVWYLKRNEHGDREKCEGTLAQYIGESIKEEELIAPTFTTYLPVKKKQSLLTLFIDANVKRRGVAKKAMFKARMDGNKLLEILKDNEQTNMKLSNNACSGAHVSASTPLYNKTAHSTLTSNCRVTAGYGSANNEKFLNGNRHYWSAEIVKQNIVSIVTNTDYAKIEAAMAEFDIRHPSVEETMDCIQYSTQFYWRDPGHMALIRLYVEKLTDVQRSAFVYTGDLYHLMKYNDSLVRRFITQLSSSVRPVEGVSEEYLRCCIWPRRTDVDFEGARALVKGAHEDHLALATQLIPNGMKGLKSSYPKEPGELGDIENAEVELVLGNTVAHVTATVMEYRHLISALWVTKNVPASLARFPESIRRSALMGDTDSTIFTVQDWVKWYNNGRIGFDERSSGVAASMIFLSAQAITHLLARMSANFGVEESRIFQTAMKNEYKFDVFTPTQVAKHYFASIGCQEGNLYAAQVEEIKGVHLKSSNAPPKVMKMAKSMMMEIMDTVMREEKIVLMTYLTRVADLERDIKTSILERQSPEYFRVGQIKTAESYTLPPEKSNYAHYLFWNETFGKRYGQMGEPPFSTVKISVQLGSAAKIRAWLANMADRELAKWIEEWMVKFGKKAITTFHVPEQVIQSGGIPKEILGEIYVRKIQIDTVNVFYLILQSLGVYMQTNKSLQLVSDFY